MKFKRRVLSIFNYAKFVHFLCQGVFGSKSSSAILKVLCKFVELEAPFYSTKVVMGRSINKSIQLLNALVASYIETKSETTLDQILEVLKTEFLLRSENGRK